MKRLNIEFLELYKNVDCFIKDEYSSDRGVSQYIELMEVNSAQGQYRVKTWAEDYKMLKHVRWVRNRLSHDESFSTDIVSAEDHEWLQDFKKRLLSERDPLSLLRKSAKQRTVSTKTNSAAKPAYGTGTAARINGSRNKKAKKRSRKAVGFIIAALALTAFIFIAHKLNGAYKAWLSQNIIEAQITGVTYKEGANMKKAADITQNLKNSINDAMSLEEILDEFEKNCSDLSEDELLLFETGTFSFTGEPLFYFSLVRQLPGADDEFIQIHVNVLYEPSKENKRFFDTLWSDFGGGSFFEEIRSSKAYNTMKDTGHIRVEVYMDET